MTRELNTEQPDENTPLLNHSGICPITQENLSDYKDDALVILSDGHCYSMEGYKDLLKTSQNPKSPMTRQPLKEGYFLVKSVKGFFNLKEKIPLPFGFAFLDHPDIFTYAPTRVIPAVVVIPDLRIIQAGSMMPFTVSVTFGAIAAFSDQLILYTMLSALGGAAGIAMCLAPVIYRKCPDFSPRPDAAPEPDVVASGSDAALFSESFLAGVVSKQPGLSQ